MFNDFFNFIGINTKEDCIDYNDFLIKNAGKTFLNGMYRIHTTKNMIKWTTIITESFPEYKGSLIAFGFDWLGRNFVLDKTRDIVLIFEPGTREVLNTAASFADFHNIEIVKYHNECLASTFFNKWYESNCHYILKHDECAGYKVPLFLNGSDTIENLEISNMEVYWEIMMSLINL